VTKVAPLRRITADDAALVFFVHWVSCFGPPLILLSDNGSQLSARMFQAVCFMMGVKQLFTSTYHPQTNGQTELFNRTVVIMLLHYVSRKQDDWDQTVAVPVYGYNTQVHSSSGLSPFELVLSRPPPVPNMEVGPVVREGKTKAGFRKEFLSRVRDLSRYTKDSLEKAPG
jgi:transposase InsO family protein